MNNIKQARLIAGLTQSELADMIGVSRVSVWKWEKDIVFPRPRRLKPVADALNTTVEKLLEGRIA